MLAGGFAVSASVNTKRISGQQKGILDRLQALRGPGESYGDVILRLAAVER